MAYDTTTTVTDDLDDNLASYHNQIKTAVDHLMSAAAYASYVNAASMTGNVTLTDSDFPIQSFSPTAARDLTLPAVASTNHPFFVINRSSSYDITVKNSGGTAIGIVAPGMVAIYLSDGSNAYYELHGTIGMQEFIERASAPSTPGTNKWRVYFKSDGLYFVDDAGVSTGPLGVGGGDNYLINGGFDRFVRADPTAAKTMTDGTYLSPDRWYSLIQGSGATEKKGASIGTSKNSLRLTAGGTTNRYGKAQALKSVDSMPYRGKTGIFQVRIKPNNNAGSGSRNYRAAILAWTGTADAITRDVVNDWTSSNYTTGNFFASTSLTLVGTATASVAHNTEGLLSISGSVPTNCNNLIVFFWTQDVPTHASDYADFAEAGLYFATTVQDWKPRLETEEIALCLHHCYPISHEPNASAYLYPPYGVRVSTNVIDVMISLMPITMFATPTLVTSSPTFATTTPSGNQIGFFNNDSNAWTTITGALTLSISNAGAAGLTFRATAGTSFNGSAGNMGNWYFGADAIIYLEAEL